MAKWVQLTKVAYVNGVLRHPSEGVLHLEDAEAKHLLDGDFGIDVSADFKSKETKPAASGNSKE